MDKIVYEANVKIEKDMYEYNLDEFNTTNDKISLINSKYKNHNMRFSLIIDRNIALENGDMEYADFLDSIINDMTNEIIILNNSIIENNINEVLDKLTFHEKVNIIFYVRPNFYDSEFEPYEILTKDAYEELSNSIIEEANNILKDYGKTLIEISKMNVPSVHKLIKNEDLQLDIFFATELVK